MASKIENAVEYAEYLAGDGNLGYSQGSDRNDVRPNGSGDCASFVITVCKEAGIDMDGATYTGDMKAALIKAGWEQIPIADRYRGCILLTPKNEHPKGQGHTALCTSKDYVVEALANEYGTAMGGKPGDQTGNEVLVRKYNGFAYYCFEPPAYAREEPKPKPEPPKPTVVAKPKPGEGLQMKPQAGNVNRLYNAYNGDHLYSADANEVKALSKAGYVDEGILGKTPSDVVIVWRLYNASTGEHLTTASYDEATELLKQGNNLSDGTKSGWQCEGAGFVAYKAGTPGKVPVYRLHQSNSYHHFTTDENEKKTLVSQGWKDEGVAYCLDK